MVLAKQALSDHGPMDSLEIVQAAGNCISGTLVRASTELARAVVLSI
jgi:hypothetical protein